MAPVYLFLACIWLVRGFSTTPPGAIQTLSTPVAVQSRRVRRWNIAVGLTFLALSIAYFVRGH